MRLNPIYPFYYLLYIGMANLTLEHFEDALEVLKRSAALNPEALHAHIYLAACFGLLGESAPARHSLAEVYRLCPDFSIKWVQTFFPYKRAPDMDRLVEGLRKAGMSD